MQYVGTGKNPYCANTAAIYMKNAHFVGNMEHSSPLTFGCGFRKIEECKIQENVDPTTGAKSLEVNFKVNIFKNSDVLDYTLDVSDLLKYGIKTFEKITYENSDIQLFDGVKDNGDRILLFIVDSYDKYLYDIFFIDGLDDHTGTIYFRQIDDKNICGYTTIATLEFTYIGNPLNFVYLPRFYNENNFTIKYPGYDDIKGTKFGGLYLPDNYSIESEVEKIKSLDLILHYLDDPHIKLFNIPIPFLIKEREDGTDMNRLYFRSIVGEGIHNYLKVQYGTKKGDIYVREYLSLTYYESSNEYGA